MYLVFIAAIPLWLLAVAAGPLSRLRRRHRHRGEPQRVPLERFGDRGWYRPIVVTGFPSSARATDESYVKSLFRNDEIVLAENVPSATQLPVIFTGGRWGRKLRTTPMDSHDAIPRVLDREHGIGRVLAPPPRPRPQEILAIPGWGKLLMWLQSRGNLTPFHYDVREGLLVQIIGRKRFLFSSPVRGLQRLRPFSAYSSPGDFYATSLGIADGGSYYGAVDDAIVYDFTIGPGEGVYIPSYWWHHVECLDDSVSATYWRRVNLTTPSNLWLGPRILFSWLYTLITRLSVVGALPKTTTRRDVLQLVDCAELILALRRKHGDVAAAALELGTSEELVRARMQHLGLGA